ncbi:MAG: hypothetical protein AAF631_10720 [Pseudomonadota bacterium]
MKTLKYVKIALFALAAAGGPIAAAQSAPPEVATRFSSPELTGETTARAWGFRLYDAELWTEDGAFSFGQKFALTLTYGARFSAELLARSTIDEIVRVEGGQPSDHSRLQGRLQQCLIDVRRGSRITGVAESPSRVSLYANGSKRCTINYPSLTKRFFGIWLAPTSRDTRGAARLTGAS